MKAIYTTLFSFLIYLSSIHSKAQLLSQNFNAGFPNNWAQNPTATWSLNSVLNSPGNCLVNNEPGASSNTTSIISPSVDLTAMTDFTISFKAAVTKNNFVAPEIVVYYDNGSSTQFLARWSSGFNPNTTYTINEGFETQDSIGTEDVIWEVCTHTISTLNGSSGRFIFTSEIVNGGWTLLDDIVISGKTVNTPTLTTGIMDQPSENNLELFPNPCEGNTFVIKGRAIKIIKMIDQLGKEIDFDTQAGSLNSTDVHLKEASSGIYYLQAILENNSIIHKKIILK